MDLDQRAAAQHGLLTRAQALEAGLTESTLRWRVESGRWQRVHPGVYAVHSGPVDWPSRAHAAVLAAGEGALLGYAAAAHVLGLFTEPPARLIVCVPNDRRVEPPSPEVWIRRRRTLHPAVVQGVPVTHAADTVLDLASVTSATRSVGYAARAVQLGLTSPAELAAALRDRRFHPHRAILRLALLDLEAGAESLLEVRFVRDVERRHGLPSSRQQAGSHVGDRAVRRDFEYEAWRVVVEVDGRLGHVGAGMWTDRRRDREAAATGRVTLRAGWVDVTGSPCAIALDVARTLRSRGWTGMPRACSPTCDVRRWP